MTKVFYSLLLLVMWPAASSAQIIERQVLGSLGGSHYSSSIEVDFTVGEAVAASVASGSFVMTQGFHQPREEESTGMRPAQPFEVSYKLYPNPATDGQVTIDLYSERQAQVKFRVVDVHGRVLYQSENAQELNPALTYTIDISRQAAGSYFVIISDSFSQQLKSIPFIKTN